MEQKTIETNPNLVLEKQDINHNNDERALREQLITFNLFFPACSGGLMPVMDFSSVIDELSRMIKTWRQRRSIKTNIKKHSDETI
ncbi:hypothetical protein [Pedobacter panaciterrae]|uniref:Uncharacterized protein n=1 Tax=Pedobacter panaciterrae TaxID=363849 RepID=A0ABU8NPS2_9SPHI|nr:hypothetical protein [uncultured Pedobacter sp.]